MRDTVATKTEEPTKSERIAVRASASQKDLIQRAAELRHKTVTEFVLDVVSREAERVVAEETHIRLPRKTWNAFVRALDNPPSPSPRLKRLMTEPSVLER